MDNNKSDLRKRAEEKSAPALHSIEPPTPERIQETLHELRVYQIELEMQNEELRKAQSKLESERARYFAFYNMSPVGFLTLSEQGLILEANIIAAAMLGAGPSALEKQPITQFIFKEDQDAYYLHHKKHTQPAMESEPNSVRIAHAGELQTLELRMLRKNSTPFWARMECLMVRDPSIMPDHCDDNAMVCRVVVTDITGRKQAEEALQKAFDDIKTLRGIVPICAWCKKIRDDNGYWQQVEVYIRNHTEADFSHGICPECRQKQDSELLALRLENTGKSEARHER
jgi:PAS domain S-box-containing protein